MTNLILLHDRRARTHKKVKDLVNEQQMNRRVTGPNSNSNSNPPPRVNSNSKSNLVEWRRPVIKHTEDWLVKSESVSVPAQLVECVIPEQFTRELTQFQQDLDENGSNYQGKQFLILIFRHSQV